MINKGFTIVEVVVSVTIMVAIVFGATLMARDVLGLNRSVLQGLVAQSDVRKAMKNIVAEIRTAVPSATGSYTIEAVSTSSMIFFADIDGDTRSERIRYYVNPGTRSLNRGVVVPTGSPASYILAQEVSSILVSDIDTSTSTAVFEFFDTNYAGTSSPLSYPIDVSLIRLVRVNLAVDKDTNRAPDALTISSEVTMRNLKDNL